MAGGMRLEEGDRGVRLEEAQQGAAALPARWLGRIWDWLLSPGGTGEGETGEGKGGKDRHRWLVTSRLRALRVRVQVQGEGGEGV